MALVTNTLGFIAGPYSNIKLCSSYLKFELSKGSSFGLIISITRVHLSHVSCKMFSFMIQFKFLSLKACFMAYYGLGVLLYIICNLICLYFIMCQHQQKFEFELRSLISLVMSCTLVQIICTRSDRIITPKYCLF